MTFSADFVIFKKKTAESGNRPTGEKSPNLASLAGMDDTCEKSDCELLV
jgi:hypothetical protein